MALIVIAGNGGTRHVPAGKPYKLGPGERIVGSVNEQSGSPLEKIAVENEIGLGSLVAAIMSTTGFKQWWEAKHGNKACAKCKWRQAVLDYIKFKGPLWLAKWVKENKG